VKIIKILLKALIFFLFPFSYSVNDCTRYRLFSTGRMHPLYHYNSQNVFDGGVYSFRKY